MSADDLKEADPQDSVEGDPPTMEVDAVPLAEATVETEAVASAEPDDAPGEQAAASAPAEQAEAEQAEAEQAVEQAGQGAEPDEEVGEQAAASAPAEQAEAEQAELERRQAGRKGVMLNRLIATRVIDGDSHRECYLHLVDISEGGLRVNSDDPFPSDRHFALEIGLAAFGTELATRQPRLTLPVRLVWSKSLVGGMVVSGLAFCDLDEQGQSIVAAIMEGASPEGRRSHFRLNRVLGVELASGQEHERWLYPLTLDLSVEGMRICLSEALEVGAKFPIKIFLEFDLPTVATTAEVMWQDVMPSGRIQVGLKFEGTSERDSLAIKTYIDQCVEQDQTHRRL